MADEDPIETSPYTDQMIAALELRMKELGEAGNFGDAGTLWQCHRVIQAMRLELRRLRAQAAGVLKVCPSLSPLSHGACWRPADHEGIHEDPGGTWSDAEAYRPAEKR